MGALVQNKSSSIQRGFNLSASSTYSNLADTISLDNTSSTNLTNYKFSMEVNKTEYLNGALVFSDLNSSSYDGILGFANHYFALYYSNNYPTVN
jgi:hypothetical protein